MNTAFPAKPEKSGHKFGLHCRFPSRNRYSAVGPLVDERIFFNFTEKAIRRVEVSRDLQSVTGANLDA